MLSSIIEHKIEHKNDPSDDFIKYIYICKYNMCITSISWICDNIIKKIPLIEIAKKFLQFNDNLSYSQKSTCYELFEIFCFYKNNRPINYKLARYLKYCNGILGSGWYFDDEYKFKIIFFTVKDIIKELDGNGFFIWLDYMCNYN